MRYIHLRSRTKHDPSEPAGAITSTVQVANDLTDQLSADDGIILSAQAFEPTIYLSDVNAGRVQCEDRSEAVCQYYQSKAARELSKQIRTPWISTKQCIPVTVNVAPSTKQTGRTRPIQVLIRAELPDKNSHNPGSGKGKGNKHAGMGVQRVPSQMPRTVHSQSTGIEPDVISFDSQAGKMVFPAIISVRTAVFEPVHTQIGVGAGKNKKGKSSTASQPESGMAQRVIQYPGGQVAEIWEDVLSSDYWASVWDAGLALSAYLSLYSSPWVSTVLPSIRSVLGRYSHLSQVTPRSQQRRVVTGIELGCGCGILGISLHLAVPESDIIVTDLPESGDLVEKNIRQAKAGLYARKLKEKRKRDAEAVENDTAVNEASDSEGDKDSQVDEVEGQESELDTGLDSKFNLEFAALDWSAPIPESILARKHDLIFLSDCTYNTDSIPALVSTLQGLAVASSIPDSPSSTPSQTSTGSDPAGVVTNAFPLILVARKIRHEDERTFEIQMAAAGFVPGETDRIDLPGNGSALAWMPGTNDTGPNDDDDADDESLGKGEIIEVMTYRHRQPDDIDKRRKRKLEGHEERKEKRK